MTYGKKRNNLNNKNMYCNINTTTNNKQLIKTKTMEKERIYIMEDENGEMVIVDATDYLNFILRMIRNTPNDMELGNKIRKEYDTLKLSLLILFNDNIEEGEEIPY